MSKLILVNANLVSRNFTQKIREVSKSRFDGDAKNIDFEPVEKKETIQVMLQFEISGGNMFDYTDSEIMEMIKTKFESNEKD